jgi:hypothetical protein
MPDIARKSGALHDGHDQPSCQKPERAHDYDPRNKHFTELQLGSVKGEGKKGHRFDLDQVDRLVKKIKAFSADLRE